MFLVTGGHLVGTYAQNTFRSLDSMVKTIEGHFSIHILIKIESRASLWPLTTFPISDPETLNANLLDTKLLTSWGHSQFKPTDKITCRVGPHTFPLSQVRLTLQADVFESTLPMYTVSESTIFSSDVILRPSKRGMCWQAQKSLPALTSHTCNVRQMPLPVLWFLNGADFCLYLFRRCYAPQPYQIAGG